jgi:hypothetical protein
MMEFFLRLMVNIWNKVFKFWLNIFMLIRHCIVSHSGKGGEWLSYKCFPTETRNVNIWNISLKKTCNMFVLKTASPSASC